MADTASPEPHPPELTPSEVAWMVGTVLMANLERSLASARHYLAEHPRSIDAD